MGKIHRIAGFLVDKNNFSTYSALFRLYLAFHVIKKIYLSWGSISLINGELLDIKLKLPGYLSFLMDIVINDVPLVYYGGILVACLYMFGIGRFYTAILFHLLCRVLSEINFMYSNGGDNILMFVSFYMIFIDSYNRFSLHPTVKKDGMLKNYLSNLGGYAVMIHLCIIYFVSAFHKIHADVWFNGVATYYVMNLERYNSPINKYFFKNAFIIGATTYFTIAFELFFPILIWMKQLRPICLVAGVLMHMGIYFTMMLYDFEILFIMIYGFFISERFWYSLVSRRLVKLPKWLQPFGLRQQLARNQPAA